ncbi:DNA-binding protein P3A2-like isoform X2 [Dreissena polymorpha]|uniref:Nuclear respiratory factor 1 NLS/DNA-binding dimerisation domain-containing protein n=2 Tax=Dreissena polymorpha TaxID=45954 RepID=A0A9D4GIM5_DREPO|nr:DNA-binding protein P3A2-like isoform X2 [Dreissena polymorpha]KAH3816134.1 hypothetical protein DPMN_117643 [Dreissena polymorpha]
MNSSGIHSSTANSITINSSHLNNEMMTDDSEPSSPDSSFDASDLMGGHGISADDITSQLAASGPIGMAAAAAINSGKRRRPHLFETNPAIRKRQQTRLLRKLKSCIEEYTTRVGQQAVVLCCTPSKNLNHQNTYKVFGSQPLEQVIKNAKSTIMQELDAALAEQAPDNNTDAGVYELPPLTLDGIPTPLDKMTQAQLRNFIPEMLKYSTCRSKPGWGKMECRPAWWPSDVPWANVRSDVRTEEQKKRVSWTDALRTIVKNCYKHHGREDLLNIFGEISSMSPSSYIGTMIQTINNPDGTVSIIQIDTGPNSVVTLPDGSQATVVHSMTAMPQENINQLTSDMSSQNTVVVETSHGDQNVGLQGGVEVTGTIGSGRFVLPSGETVQINTDPNTGIMTIPASIYQSLVNSSQANSIDLGNTQVILASSQGLSHTSVEQLQHQYQHQHMQQQSYQLQQQQQQMMEVAHQDSHNDLPVICVNNVKFENDAS